MLNYGDLLFPTVATHYLADDSTSFTFVSPKGGAPVCPDAETTVGVLDFPWREAEFDLALIGGGNIVSPMRTKLPDYVDPPRLGVVAYPALWLAACLKAAQCGAAVAWNAPGVMHLPWTATQCHALQACVTFSEYAAFREDGLPGGLKPGTGGIESVPDTAVTLAKIWPKSSLEASWQAVRERFAIDVPYFVVHLKKRNVRDSDHFAEMAHAIAGVSRSTGLRPLLLPIGLCHGDQQVADDLSKILGVPHITISGTPGLRETTPVIAHARHVFTASLHCGIIAAAYGVPCHVLETRGNPKYRAFFEGHLAVEGVVVSDLIPALTAVSMEESQAALPRLSASVEQAVERVVVHFQAIRTAASAPADRKERGIRLHRALHEGLDQAVPVASFLPLGALL